MEKKWTIFYVIHAKDTYLSKYADQLIAFLESYDWNLSECNVVYLINSYTNIRVGSRRKRAIQAILYQIEKSATTEKFQSKELKNFGAINIGAVINLKEVFEYVYSNFDAKRIMLFTWDHGSGFGVWEADPSSRNFNRLFASMKSTSLVETEGASTSNGFFMITNNAIAEKMEMVKSNFTVSDKNIFELWDKVENMYHFESDTNVEETDILTNEELSKAIHLGFKGRKIDILVMVNCFMQMFETGYSLKNNVKYLVAAETSFWPEGFHYRSVFDKLKTKPETDTEEIAKLFISSVEKAYQVRGLEVALDDVVVSACNLEYSDEIANVMDELIVIVNSDPVYCYPIIAKSRKICKEISVLSFEKERAPVVEPYPLFIVDIIYFLFLLKNEDNRMAEIFDKFSVFIDKYIVERRIGKEFRRRGNMEEINGFSIYFPEAKKNTSKDYYKYFYKDKSKLEIDFSKERTWSKFLPVYLKDK